MLTCFPCFFSSGPIKKSKGSRLFALRPLHKALLILQLDVTAHAESFINKKKYAHLETSKFRAIAQVSIHITDTRTMWYWQEHWFLHKDNKLRLSLPDGVGLNFGTWVMKKYCLNRKTQNCEINSIFCKTDYIERLQHAVNFLFAYIYYIYIYTHTHTRGLFRK